MEKKSFPGRKYLIEIPHPHFVYFFKEVIRLVGEDEVLITCQSSGIITDLLDGLNMKYVVVGKKYSGLFNKAIGQLVYIYRFMALIRKHRVKAVWGMSPALAIAARFRRVKMFFFDDDDSAVQPLIKHLTVPLASYIITPACLAFENYGKRHLTYAGYQELAYLAPNYFQPDPLVLSRYGLEKDQYVIIRFNDFKAHHDRVHSGIPEGVRKELVQLIEKTHTVYITTEGNLEDDFKPYQLNINPIDVHSVMYYAKMYIGDSQTMASEAAVLGTPSIRCNTFKNKISYLNELEYTYKLTFAFYPHETAEMLSCINQLLNRENLRLEWLQRKNTMLNDMEDVPRFISYTIKKYVG